MGNMSTMRIAFFLIIEGPTDQELWTSQSMGWFRDSCLNIRWYGGMINKRGNQDLIYSWYVLSKNGADTGIYGHFKEKIMINRGSAGGSLFSDIAHMSHQISGRKSEFWCDLFHGHVASTCSLHPIPESRWSMSKTWLRTGSTALFLAFSSFSTNGSRGS